MCSAQSTGYLSQSDIDNCQVCKQPAHGIHFGVLTCRACAAFFKRAHKFSEKPCRLEKGVCGTYKNGRFYCKGCRMRKCLQLGMKLYNARSRETDIETPATTSVTKSKSGLIKRRQRKDLLMEKVPPNMSSFVGRPGILVSFEPDLRSPVRTLIDMYSFVSEAESIFKNKIELAKNISGLSQLEKLTFGLNRIREAEKGGSKNITKVSKNETLSFWKSEFLMTANWLTYCDEFQKLPYADRLKVLKSMWMLWSRLEKLSRNASLRIKKENNAYGIVSMENETSIPRKIELDVSWFSNYTQEQLKYYMDPDINDFNDEVVSPLQKMQPTPTEQAFMLSQISFQFAGKFFQGDILKSTEKMLDILSNDLHNYYTNQLNMPNYCGRLAQLLKINNLIKKNVMEQVERKKLGCLFDIFSIDFTHPEIFMYRNIE